MRRITVVTVLAATLLLPAGIPWEATASAGTAQAGTPGTGAARTDPTANPNANVPDSNLQESVKPLYADRAALSLLTSESVSPLEEEYSSGGTTTVRISSDVLFEFGKATLTAVARKRLDAIAAKLGTATGQVRVIGYTDSVGSPAANLRLSRQRAEAVKAQLAKALSGATARILASGRGEANPVEPNTSGGKDSPAGRAKNRRVEITYRN